MKYGKLRGNSIPELMMQLRSEYGQSAYIIETKEIKRGGVFGSDLLAKKQYEIEFMVSEGDPSYSRGRPQSQRPPSKISIPEKSASLPVIKPVAEPVVAAKPIPTTETNLNDLDALIESLKSFKTKTVLESRPQPEKPAKSQPKIEIAEAPTKEELAALLKNEPGIELMPALNPSRNFMIQSDELEKDAISRIRQRLIESQGSVDFVDRFMNRLERSLSEEDRLHPNRVRSRSVERMKELIRLVPSIDYQHGERKVVFFVGPNGSGKTTNLTKVAFKQMLDSGKNLSVYSIDRHRLAASAQLEQYAEVLTVPFYSPLFETDFREFLDRDGSQLVFVDTAGMGLRSHDRRDELLRYIEVVHESVEVHLVLPASLSPSLTEKYMEFFEPTGFEKILLTHLDESEFLANFIEAADKWKRTFSFFSNSPDVGAPLLAKGTEDLAKMVLGLSE
ncbi:MAG: hypothetical protein H3C43_09270 [Leptonema sp. (in: Bacteria)]|nr:hypothetical protein [Leptonema sp. (in: bacteria)]